MRPEELKSKLEEQWIHYKGSGADSKMSHVLTEKETSRNITQTTVSPTRQSEKYRTSSEIEISGGTAEAEMEKSTRCSVPTAEINIFASMSLRGSSAPCNSNVNSHILSLLVMNKPRVSSQSFLKALTAET